MTDWSRCQQLWVLTLSHCALTQNNSKVFEASYEILLGVQHLYCRLLYITTCLPAEHGDLLKVTVQRWGYNLHKCHITSAKFQFVCKMANKCPAQVWWPYFFVVRRCSMDVFKMSKTLSLTSRRCMINWKLSAHKLKLGGKYFQKIVTVKCAMYLV